MTDNLEFVDKIKIDLIKQVLISSETQKRNAQDLQKRLKSQLSFQKKWVYVYSHTIIMITQLWPIFAAAKNVSIISSSGGLGHNTIAIVETGLKSCTHAKEMFKNCPGLFFSGCDLAKKFAYTQERGRKISFNANEQNGPPLHFLKRQVWSMTQN